MSNYDIAKEWLNLYRPLKARLKILTMQILRAENNLLSDDGVTAINYDGITTSKTYKISSIVENQVIDTLTKLEDARAERELVEDVLTQIEIAVESLKVDEMRIIKLYYFNDEKLSWWKVARIVNMSEKHCKQYLHTKALQTISKAMKSYDIKKFA